MLSVWNSGQAVRNDTQLAMMQVAWQYNESDKGYEIDTTYLALRLPPNPDGSAATLPLSWHLTEKQKTELDSGVGPDGSGLQWPVGRRSGRSSLARSQNDADGPNARR